MKQERPRFIEVDLLWEGYIYHKQTRKHSKEQATPEGIRLFLD